MISFGIDDIDVPYEDCRYSELYMDEETEKADKPVTLRRLIEVVDSHETSDESSYRSSSAVSGSTEPKAEGPVTRGAAEPVSEPASGNQLQR